MTEIVVYPHCSTALCGAKQVGLYLSNCCANSSHILVYGHDKILLDTRSAILRTAYIGADIARNREAFEAKMDEVEGQYRLYILCHTISSAERDEIRLATVRSGVRVYTIYPLLPPDAFLIDIQALLSEINCNVRAYKTGAFAQMAPKG